MSRASYPQVQDTPAGGTAWLDEEQLAALAPGPVVLEWLTFEGLLTPRLRRNNAHPVSLEVLREEPVGQTDTGADWLREVALSAGDERLIYALSWFPAAVVSHNTWLQTLARKPLGDALSAMPQVARSKFEFMALHPGQPRYERAVQGCGSRPQVLWARRSHFQLAGGSALVEEVFLPGVFRSEA
jgi:chorismate-pyruvate lyase